MKKSHKFWLNTWYGKSIQAYGFLPFSWLFSAIALLRKYWLIVFFQQTIPVPVIVVGNISVGGTGKTPLLIALVEYLQQQGHIPGVVSRGYGGTVPQYPYLLNEATTAEQSGDEPLLIFNITKCDVCVAPDRVAAAQMLVKRGCTIILSDDGLQHYRLGRDLEIAVVDGVRLFGNGFCLPAGPLREPLSRLKTVDLVVVNNPQQLQPINNIRSFAMDILPTAWRQLINQHVTPLASLEIEDGVHAVAGIGNPARFFKTLERMDINCVQHPFSDHHHFAAADFLFAGDSQVLMTEKDAVKCAGFAKPNWYSLIISAELPADFWQKFQQKLNAIQDVKK